MKVSEASVLLLGEDAAGHDHWLERWGTKLSTARGVGGSGADLTEAINATPGPVVVVAHGHGVERLVEIADEVAVRGAFLVAPHGGNAMEARDEPLPFPSILVASRNDPDRTYESAEAMGARWGSEVMDAGEAGALDSASGHGPWPEGLMVFARFLSRLPGDN